MRASRTQLLLPAVAAVAATGIFVAMGSAGPTDFTKVPNAQTKMAGIAAPTVLSPELAQLVVPQGSQKLENGTASIPYYGYDGDGPMVPAPGAVQSTGVLIEATKTEPDKNTYLVLQNQQGADATYNYGTHFLYQGHE